MVGNGGGEAHKKDTEEKSLSSFLCITHHVKENCNK